jgi:uncharacterized membrane protein YhaH (DUF805 family)
MLLDHIGFYFADRLPPEIVLLLRAIGRLAFPIFAWSVARGYSRTRRLPVYFLRMSLFAAIAEVIIRSGNRLIGLSLDGTNVLVTFTLSLVLLAGVQLATRSFHDMVASLRPIPAAPHTLPAQPHFDVRIGLPLGSLMVLLSIAAALWLKPDYSLFGMAAVLVFYLVQEYVPDKDQEKRSLQAFIILNAVTLPLRLFWLDWSLEWAALQCLGILAVPLCFRLDRTERPGPVLKYFFYIFYPLHLFLLSLLRFLLQ